MANNKTGFAYYSADTDRFLDIRIKRLKKDLGCTGFSVYEYILNEIYRVKGCFLVWDESTAFDVAEYWGLKENTVNEIVNYCGSVGLFDKELLSRGGVLTSRSIQSRFIEMCVRAKRKDFKIPEEYQIIPEESIKIPEESPQNAGSLPQNKVKESKEELPPLIPPKGDESEPPPVWKKNFEVFLEELRSEYKKIIADKEWILKQEKFNPGVDIQKSIEKSCVNYWATEGGWKKKKGSKIKSIDWKSTFANAVSLKQNRVYKDYVSVVPEPQEKKPSQRCER